MYSYQFKILVVFYVRERQQTLTQAYPITVLNMFSSFTSWPTINAAKFN